MRKQLVTIFLATLSTLFLAGCDISPNTKQGGVVVETTPTKPVVVSKTSEERWMSIRNDARYVAMLTARDGDYRTLSSCKITPEDLTTIPGIDEFKTAAKDEYTSFCQREVLAMRKVRVEKAAIAKEKARLAGIEAKKQKLVKKQKADNKKQKG